MATSTSPTVAEQFTEVFNRNIEKIERNVYDKSPAEYDKILKVEKTTRLTDEFLGFQGIGRPVRNRDLEPLPQVSPNKTYKSVIRQVPYRSQLTIEESLMRYSESPEIFNNMEDMVESEKSLKDAVASDLFNNGFSAQATDFTEADNTQRALFSTGHVTEDNNTIYSNYYNVAVPPNTDTLYLIIGQYLSRLKDGGGNFLGMDGEFTIITPTLNSEFMKAADQIVMSMDNPETANRAANTVNRRFKLKHLPLNNLTSSTKWYVTVGTDRRYYPLVMRVGIDREITPLEKLGPQNPHAYVSTLRTHFGVGLRYSARGVVAVGS